MPLTSYDAFPDYVTEGVPESGAARVSKATVRQYLDEQQADLQTLWDKTGGGWVTARDFDPTAGSGSNDASAVQQAMANGAPFLVDRPLLIDAAAILTSSASKRIIGFGTQASVITMTNPTQDGLVKAGNGGLLMEGVKVTTTVDKSAGTAVKVSGTGLSVVRNCQITGANTTTRLFRGVEMNGVIPTLEGCYLLLIKDISAYIHNDQPASGGSEAYIGHNWFNSGVLSPTGPTAIFHNNGGGPIRVKDNLIQNFDFGYNGYYDGVGTGVGLEFTGNNVASCRTIAVNLEPTGSGATMDIAKIENCTFNMTGAGRALNIQAGAAAGNWLQRWRFANNLCLLHDAGFVTSAAGVVGELFGNSWHGAADVVAISVGTYTTGGAGGKLKDADLKYNITTLRTFNGNGNWSSL